MAVRWAARRAAASQSGSDGAAWLEGKSVRAVACDAMVIPVVTGQIDPGALDELVSLCLRFAGHGPHCATRPNAGRPGSPARRQIRPVRLTRPRAQTQLTEQASSRIRPTPRASPRIRPTTRASPRTRPAPARPARGRPPPRPGRCSGTRSSARPSTWCPVPAGWRASCGPGCSAPGCAGPSLPLDVGHSAEIPTAIRRAVILRDQHCRWAGGYFLYTHVTSRARCRQFARKPEGAWTSLLLQLRLRTLRGRRGGRTCTLMAINAVISLRKESGGHLRAATARRYQIPTTGPAGPWASRALHGPRLACRWRWQPACYLVRRRSH